MPIHSIDVYGDLCRAVPQLRVGPPDLTDAWPAHCWWYYVELETKTQIVVVDTEPVFFSVRDGPMMPTLRTLHKCGSAATAARGRPAPTLPGRACLTRCPSSTPSSPRRR